jgi:phenylpropionate dioxygenase-like ring-hydroxylating dioxygenase large terminal subunit
MRMSRDTELDIVRRLSAHLRSRTTDLAAAEMYVPARHYFDVDHASKERTNVFLRYPLIVAHGSQLPRPGDFLTLEVLGSPLLLVRQADGSVRAFSNACRHRGAKVVTEPQGNKPVFNCSYHGWCYGQDGKLRTIPFDDGFVGLDRSRRSLLSLPAAERHGLVWVIPTTTAPSFDIDDYVGDALGRELQGYAMDMLLHERTVTFDMKSNWKLIIEGLLDAYHIQFLHPRTTALAIFTNLNVFDAFGRHARSFSPPLGFGRLSELPSEQINLVDQPSVFVNYFLAPNTVLIVEQKYGIAWTFTTFPDPANAGRTHIVVRVLMKALPTNEDEQRVCDRRFELLRKISIDEDWATTNGIQKGLPASGLTDIVIGRNEPAIQHLHRFLADAMAADAPLVTVTT